MIAASALLPMLTYGTCAARVLASIESIQCLTRRYSVFEVKEQNTNGSSTPPSSPSVEIESPDAPRVLLQSPPSQVSPSQRYQPSRHSSLRNSVGGSDDAVDMEVETDESMDLTNNSITVSEEDSQPNQPSEAEHDKEEDEDGSVDMDMTMNTNPASRRQSRAPVVPRRRSSRRPAAAPSNADTSGEPVEFTIALGDRLKGEVEPAPEWYALQQLILGRNDRDDPPPKADAENSNPSPNDMDLQSAMQRMLAAGAEIIQDSAHATDDVSVSSTSSGEDSIDMGDKTMNLTRFTGGIRRASTTQHILPESLDLPSGSSSAKPVLSVSTSSQTTLPRDTPFTPKPQPSTSMFRTPLNPVTPAGDTVTTTPGPVSALKAQSRLPVFKKTPVQSGAESPALPSTPKPKPQGFTTPFAPSLTPKSPGRTNLKRPFSVDDGENAVGSPAKKIVVPGEGGVGTKGVPATPKSPTKIPLRSPVKTLSRKAGGPLKRLSAITPGGSATARRASLRRASLATPKPPSPIEESAPISAPAPLVFPPPASLNIEANVSTLPSRNEPRTPSPRRASVVTPAPPPPAVEVTPRAYAREEARQATAPVVPATSPIRSPARPALADLPPSSVPVSPAPLATASPWSKFSRGRTSSYALSQIDENTYMGGDTGVYTISESGEEVDVPKQSLEEFLEMTGVTFMDNMTAHRRSTMALQSSRDPNAGPRAFDSYIDRPDTHEGFALQRPLLISPRQLQSTTLS